MGSTLTAVVELDSNLYVAHVGDSRLYRIRDQRLEQITEDHTKVQEMVREGLITKESARNHPQRHVITRCIGRKKRFEPDVFRMDVASEDLFLLCTDGLTDMLSDDEIQDHFQDQGDLGTISEALVESANEQGGLDNITVLIFAPRDASPSEDTTHAREVE
jgi:protein phosphatase